jgi:hypothetical protein
MTALLTNPNEHHVAVFSRIIKGWMYETFNTDGEIEIPCLETTLSLEQIYAGIEIGKQE